MREKFNKRRGAYSSKYGSLLHLQKALRVVVAE